MSKQAPKSIRLCDYQATFYEVEHVYLHFDITEERTLVKAVIDFYRNEKVDNWQPKLILNGEDMRLLQISIDGKALDKSDYQLSEHLLQIENCPEKFTLETEVEIMPHENTQLAGLYKSGANFCTQCESHGFRRITYFYDRPDVMTRFTTCITAAEASYPLLLSNGNCVEEKNLADGRHWVKWEDPSKKPCYLFALVAGDLEELSDQFITMSGRKIALRLFVERGFLDQADYAMASLKRAMRWDEEAFGREYDLDIFMIVAVSDFNMGAMENKGLNIFNTKYVLAKKETATDQDFIAVEAVIGHEYFHNWSGNRITCRDWFQITLKEGLTVFRDQQFTMAMTSQGVKRIDDVNIMRNVQFLQDAGPMAHPIRPEEYIEVNNFYTVTVYNKGAEVIRMLHTLLGGEVFHQAMDLYFSRFDEMAVTTDDFLQVMAEVSARDLTTFKHWYQQAGTPVVDATAHYDAQEKTWSLTLKQLIGDSPGQPAADKKPFVIPVAIGLLDDKGSELPLFVEGHRHHGEKHMVLELTETEQTFVFEKVTSAAVPSLLRDFSAPVKLNYDYGFDDDALLMKHDRNAFVRWDAAQRLFTRVMMRLVDDIKQKRQLKINSQVLDVVQHLLKNPVDDRQLLARILCLPSENYLLQHMEVADVDCAYQARLFLQQQLAEHLQSEWEDLYHKVKPQGEYVYDKQQVGNRSLAQVCLSYLARLQAEDKLTESFKLIAEHYHRADNMTDHYAALCAVIHIDCPLRDELLQAFYEAGKTQPLVLDKWFAMQASSKLPTTLKACQNLLQHADYDPTNPNKIRSLVGAFSANLYAFHAEDGSGYRFLTEQIIVHQAANPQIAARLCEPLTRYRQFDADRQIKMKACLQQLLDLDDCCKDVYEIAEKSLAAS